MHGHEDASLRGLEAIAHVGQGPTDDDAHGVRQVAVFKLVRNIKGIVAIAVPVRG